MKRKGFFLLLLISALLLLLPNGLYSAFDKDEPKYLEAAYEMVKTGDYVTPYYNYEYRFDKPILTYWLIALGYKVFGVNEFGGRFFVSIFGVLTVLIFYLWIAKYKSEKFAFWSSLILLSLLDFIVMSSVAMPDVILTFFITATLVSFFEGHHRKNPNFHRLAFLFSGLATLTKGPVGFVLPAVAAVVYLTIRRELKAGLRSIPWFSGILIYLTVVLPWYAAVLEKHGYQFFKDFILFHNVHRFFGKIPGHPTSWWYYFANYFWLYLPWVFFFPFALYRLFKGKDFLHEPLLEFSAVWFFSVFLFFQAAHTKLAHYLLPSFPPFALITSWYLESCREKLPIYLTALYFSLLFAAGVGFWIYKEWPLWGALFLIFPLMGSIFALKSGRALKPITVSFLAGMAIFKWVTLHSLQPFRAKPEIGKKLAALKEKYPNSQVAFFDYTSPEIVFYYRKGKLPDLNREKTEEVLKSSRPAFVVTRKNRLKRLKNVKFNVVETKKELLTNHYLVILSNVPLGRNDGRN